MRKFLELCVAVQDLPRHLGQHSGGMVICQGQLDSIVPLEPATMPGRVVVQWDKEDCADMGIIKVDLLGLGMMAVLEDSFSSIRDHYREEVDLAKLPADDPEVYARCKKPIPLACSRSKAARRCHAFRAPSNELLRHRGTGSDHSSRADCGSDGESLFNAAAGKPGRRLSASFAGAGIGAHFGCAALSGTTAASGHDYRRFSGGEAEELRRALGFKRRENGCGRSKSNCATGMQRNGIPREAQEQIILSITSFALYGFPESHAASFALIAYASAYLKCHYLAAFTAALLNNQPMGFYHPSTIVKDAQRHGLRVKPIDINCSEWPCTLETDGGTTMSEASLLCVWVFAMQKGCVRSRRRPFCVNATNGRSNPIADLAYRVLELRRNELVLLASIGALNSIGCGRTKTR